jgi:hypothetical protein
VDYPLGHTGDARPDQDLLSAAPSSPAASVDDEAKITHDGYVVYCDLPETLPNIKEWVALLRAYLGPEINAILYDDDEKT